MYLNTEGYIFFQLNINSFLLKIDKLRHLVKLTNADAIGISALKSVDSMVTLGIQFDDYDLLVTKTDR